MNRISVVGPPAVDEDRVTVPGAAAAVPERREPAFDAGTVPMLSVPATPAAHG